jgi:hypothetical protein
MREIEASRTRVATISISACSVRSVVSVT